jgi:hypothetical protein
VASVVKKGTRASTKLSGSHRYVLTDKGSTTITAVLTARQANINQLTEIFLCVPL